MSDEEYVSHVALLADAGHALTQLAAVIARRNQLEDRLASAGPDQLARLRAQLQNLDALVVAQHAMAATLVNEVNATLLTSEKYVRRLARAAGLRGGLLQ